MTMFENLDLNLRGVAKDDIEQMIRDCKRELDRREQEARDNAMNRILEAIDDYVNEYGSLEINRADCEEENVSIYIHSCDTLIGQSAGLISVVLV